MTKLEEIVSMATKYAPRHRHRRVLPLRFLPAICALCLLLGFLLGRGVQALSVGDPLSAETMGADAKDWVLSRGRLSHQRYADSGQQ